MNRFVASLFGIAYFSVPLFPSFITLAPVTVPGVSLLPTSMTVGVLVLMTLVAVASIVLLLVPPRMWPPTLTPLLLWLGAGIVAATFGFSPGAGLLFIAIFSLGIVWHLMTLRYYAMPGVSTAIFWCYVTSGGLAALAAIVMVVTKQPANQYGIGHARAIGTFILPGELAGYLILFLPAAFGIARATSQRALRVAAYAALGVGAAAFLMTFSRAGWMGLAAAVAFYSYMAGGVRRRYAPLILLAGLAAVLLVFNVHHDPSENFTRLSIWQAGIEIARRFPLTGVGPFDFARVYPLVRLPDGDATAFHAHSFLLTALAETGIVGVIAVLWMWWRFAVALEERLRDAPARNAALALAVTAGLVGTWVQGLIDTVSVVIFGLWLPTLALALVTASHGPAE
ncbi:MAG: O-antigen ligase family protein [Candidatus Eremiobacteraeota bacterium]|nr:O-antigen ligase family protein [Candidatus Eremiobacteraeota bacterium]